MVLYIYKLYIYKGKMHYTPGVESMKLIFTMGRISAESFFSYCLRSRKIKTELTTTISGPRKIKTGNQPLPQVPGRLRLTISHCLRS